MVPFITILTQMRLPTSWLFLSSSVAMSIHNLGLILLTPRRFQEDLQFIIMSRDRQPVGLICQPSIMFVPIASTIKN